MPNLSVVCSFVILDGRFAQSWVLSTELDIFVMLIVGAVLEEHIQGKLVLEVAPTLSVYENHLYEAE
jgi:hypothetical protein